MGVITRSKVKAKHKLGPQRRHKEYDTPTKGGLFKLLSKRKENHKTFGQVCDEEDVPERTVRDWISKARRDGSPIAKRRTGKWRTGRPVKLSDGTLDMLLSPSRNPVRKRNYVAQISYHKLNVTERTLINSLWLRRRARLFKQARVKKIGSKNKDARVQYGHDHENDTVDSFWAFVHWTDEAHVDGTSMSAGRALRQEGTRYNPENLAEMPPLEGVTLHIAASVSYYHKSELIFYNDPNDIPNAPTHVQIDQPQKKIRKPTQRKSESEEQFHQSERFLAWQANLPHEVEIRPKGNSMTQAYYTHKLLPMYLKWIEHEKAQKRGRNPILQEDNDPSHGTRSKINHPTIFKEKHHIETMTHPAQSPDLNPMEAVWNILKQRVLRREWDGTLEHLKQLLLEEWAKIEQREIQARIKDMPRRCKLLIKTGGMAIKSAEW